MTPDPFGVVWVHDCLRCGTNGHSLFKRTFSGMCNPCYLCCESFNVRLLSLEDLLRHKQRKCAVFDANALDSSIEPALYFLPDEVRRRFEDILKVPLI